MILINKMSDFFFVFELNIENIFWFSFFSIFFFYNSIQSSLRTWLVEWNLKQVFFLKYYHLLLGKLWSFDTKNRVLPINIWSLDSENRVEIWCLKSCERKLLNTYCIYNPIWLKSKVTIIGKQWKQNKEGVKDKILFREDEIVLDNKKYLNKLLDITKYIKLLDKYFIDSKIIEKIMITMQEDMKHL